MAADGGSVFFGGIPLTRREKIAGATRQKKKEETARMMLEMWLLMTPASTLRQYQSEKTLAQKLIDEMTPLKNRRQKHPILHVPLKTTEGELDEITTSISISPWYVDAAS